MTASVHKDIEETAAEMNEEIRSFENRWRYAVFPAMVAFVILAVFGFYLIYGMLQRMEALSDDVHRMTNLLEKTMPEMTKDLDQMNETISHHIPEMNQGIESMSNSTQHIAATTVNMSNSVWEMNRNVSKPMAMLSKMVPPFVGGSKTPRPNQNHYYVPNATSNPSRQVYAHQRQQPQTTIHQRYYAGQNFYRNGSVWSVQPNAQKAKAY